MSNEEIHGVNLYYERTGAGSPPLLLVHGYTGSSHDFALVVPELETDREVVTVDHRGHGQSTKTGSLDGYDFDTLVGDLGAFVDRVVGGPIDLLGHSMGGRIALGLVAERPDLVRSLILMDTSAWSFTPSEPAVAEMVQGFFASYDPADPPERPVLGPEVGLIEQTTPVEWQDRKAEMDAAVDPYAIKALGQALFSDDGVSMRDHLAAIGCPVTVIVGELDGDLADQAPELAASVPDGRLEVIAGAYHSPQLTHRDQWVAAVKRHLARTPAAG
ncbi:MAG TPA: alpha/beta hydrolase [Acidimicrobiales bacterium]|jgi:pimeloyl-ACP methyl ester carboxylesterase|nr:alpha/beta hydrolase [Acidimicrobiales bacterium]